jgi:penicillin amidase
MKWLKRLLLASVALLAVLSALVFLWLRLSLPQIVGDIALAGLTAPVEIHRDGDGIPFIRAADERDAAFALGFVHAQDRFWQMELQRRTGAGRLSELFGSATLDADRFLRTLGLMDLAEQSAALLDPPVRALFEAYAAGVNAYIEGASVLPVEYTVLRARPEPWRPADSLVWGRLMALNLSNNWTDELMRARLARRLSPEQIEALWPPDDPATAVRLARAEPPALADAGQVERLVQAIPDALKPMRASNVWALAGSRTATDKPILANDPHLGFGNPNLWYLARVETPNLTLTGATVPGTPLLVLGHNGHIAWGLTTTHSDTQDIFIERLAPGDPGRYLTPGGSAAFDLKRETIRRRDGPDVILTVRRSRHGPVISDVSARADNIVEPGTVLALAATALLPDDRTAQAFYGLNRARDWADFVQALRDFHAPQQNIAYADRAGHIGVIAPARVPIRRAGDGRWPAPGWTGTHDWTGFVPFDALPRHLDPPSGRIVNANNRIVGPDYPYLLTDFWFPPYRARRIETVLNATPRHDLNSMAALQRDHIALDASDLLPLLLAVPPRTTRARAAHDMLRRWDFAMARDRPEPLIYAAWMAALARGLYGDELGPAFAQFRAPRPAAIQRMLTQDKAWCDDVTTPETETCETIVADALERALDGLAAAHGADLAVWRWGAAHRARFRHQPFGRLPILGPLTDIEIETDGGPETVNRGETSAGTPEPFLHVHGAGYRAVYDLADLDRSLFIATPGQSGHRLSPHYRDLLERWRDGRYVTMPREPATIAATLTLRPPDHVILPPP